MVFTRMFAAHVLANSIFALGARSGEFEKAGSKALRLLKKDLPLPRQDDMAKIRVSQRGRGWGWG